MFSFAAALRCLPLFSLAHACSPGARTQRRSGAKQWSVLLCGGVKPQANIVSIKPSSSSGVAT
jgi:hypothetical protein